MRIANRKALRNYHILESLEAGIELIGPEVKSIRQGRIDLGESYAKVIGNQVFLVNAQIPAYQNARLEGYNPARSRRLLFHRAQIESLIGKISRSGMAIVPLAVYIKNNYIKVSLGLGRSKKQFDKRKVLKERDHLRRIEQELRGSK